ncbi:hypothetical protein DXG01_003195, partial [Tephrocybe rancida]
MPPADNNLTAQPVLDGKKPFVGKRIFDRVKGSKSTKSSSAPSAAATQSMENLTAPDGKLSAVKRLLAPFKGSKSPKSSSTQNTPAAQSVENSAALGASAANIAANIGAVTAPAAPEAAVSAQVVTAAGPALAMTFDQGSPPTPAAAAPTSAINVNQGSFPTAVPSLISQTAPAMNHVSLTNINQSTQPGSNVPHGQMLRVANESSSWNPILKSALGSIVAVIDLVKTMSDNLQDMKDTLVCVQGLLPILETSVKRLEGCKDGFGKGSNVLAFGIMMRAELEKIWQMQSHGLFRRVLQGPKNAGTLLGVYKNISEALEQFKIAQLDNVQTSRTAAHTAYIQSDTVDQRTCTPGTRLNVLKGILSWLQQPDGEPVYWLTGPAGIGKTTIAKTICKLVDDRENACLAESLAKDSELAHASLEIQLKQMLIQPWEASVPDHVGLPHLIIVVDALDENQSGSKFLQHLLQAVGATELRGLKFFVTSREDEKISSLCNSLPPGTVLHLQDIQKQIVQDDIGLYLTQSLPGIHSNTSYQELLGKLKKRSDGLFIYAATVIKTVTANDAAVIEQVDLLQGIIDSIDSPQLGDLYCQIVRDAVVLYKSRVQASRLQVLHTILCAMHPISNTVVAQLAKTTVDVGATALKKLHAVMYKAHDGMIYIYHASFADYILQTSTAAETEFDPHCNVGLQHAFLAQRSYDIMEKQLCFNICGLESSFVKDADVQNLDKRIQEKIDSTLKYAVLMWMAHLNSATDTNKALLNVPHLFVEKLLLYWVEVVNLLNARREGMQMLDMIRLWINRLGFMGGGMTSDDYPDLRGIDGIGISPDGKQVVSGSSDNSVHIWDALTGDLFKELKGHTDIAYSVAFSLDGGQVVSGGADSSVCIWDVLTGDLVGELRGHTDSVLSVAFSPDGKQVVSESMDHSVHIWDLLTGDLVGELKGHTDSVRLDLFSIWTFAAVAARPDALN